MTRRLVYILPVLAFVTVAVVLFRSLFLVPERLPSVFINKPAPSLALPAFNAQQPGFTHADLTAGRVTVVNFFASWCAPCWEEAPTLMALSKQSGFTLAGVTYKDKRPNTEAMLTQVGNPFAAIVADDEGRAAIDWGVTAAPETFVVDGKGIIRFKYVGPLDARIVAEQLMPAIKAAQGS